MKVPPPEEGVASRNPWNLLPFYTYNSSWHGARAEGWLGESWDTSEQPCAALAPAQLSHRRNHVPLVSQPWQQEGKLISQGPGVTDLELAFSELRLQCVLPEPCRCQGSEGTVQPGWQRWADTAGEEPCASPGSCWPLPCNPASMGSPHLPPQLQELGPGLGTPSVPSSSTLSVSPEFRGWLCPALLLYQPHSRVRVLLRDTQLCPCSLVMLKSEEDKVEQQGRAWGFQKAPGLPRREQLPLVMSDIKEVTAKYCSVNAGTKNRARIYQL